MTDLVRIAKRGTVPAYVNAPRRLRQSDIDVPFQAEEVGRPGFAVTLAGFALSRFQRLNPFGRSSLSRRRS